MKILLSATLIVILLCGAQGLTTGPFTTTISTPPQIKVGQDVTCKVTITNNHNRDYQLLKRGTPLEDLTSNIFTVSHNGRVLSYEGLMVRRTSPTAQDYITIPAKSSLQAQVDISLAYGFRATGKYSVQFNTRLHYYPDAPSNSSTQLITSNTQLFLLTGSSDLPKLTKAESHSRNLTKEAPQQLGREAVTLSLSFDGRRTSSDESTAKTAYSAAYGLLEKSATSVTSNPTLYTKWFGRDFRGYKYTVQGNYLDIQSAMEKYQFVLYFHGPECKKDYYAYTYTGGSVIYLCDVYFSSPTTGYDSKTDTIVHEMSHAVAYTGDYAYSRDNALDLAKSDPATAINSADNYAYFAVEANQ